MCRNTHLMEVFYRCYNIFEVRLKYLVCIQYLNKMMHKTKRPLVVLLGGAKVSTIIGLLKRYLHVADKIIIGGGMAFTFF